MLEAWARGDFDAALALFDDGIVTRRAAPDPGTWHGHEGLVDVITKWVGTFDDFELTAEEFLDAGADVVVQVAQEGRGKGSGAPVKAKFWFVYTVGDGKIARFEMHVSRSRAMEAAGLRP